MKYVVQMELPPEFAPEVEQTPQQMEEWIGKWQALNPIGMYFHLTRRAVTALPVSSLLRSIAATVHDYYEVKPILLF